jgi:uncharacterized protein YjgD (DUF1641 family)
MKRELFTEISSLTTSLLEDKTTIKIPFSSLILVWLSATEILKANTSLSEKERTSQELLDMLQSTLILDMSNQEEMILRQLGMCCCTS